MIIKELKVNQHLWGKNTSLLIFMKNKAKNPNRQTEKETKNRQRLRHREKIKTSKVPSSPFPSSAAPFGRPDS